MILRKLRWLAAVVLAVAAPNVSHAAITILVQESGGPEQIFSGSVVNYSTLNFTGINIGTTPNSGAISSLTTTVRATPAASFDPSATLTIKVISDDFTVPAAFQNGPSTVFNNAAASSGIGGGSNVLSNTTQLLEVPLTTGSGFPTGTALGAATATATDTRPGGGVSPTTTSNISGMPGAFAIQQTITVRAVVTGPNGIETGSSLGGSASSLVVTTPAPVPAPPAILLALAAVPALGLRRVLAKKA
jgi:hypothetical protein